MTFKFSQFEPQIRNILSAPGTDLTTISAKRVRKALLDENPSLSAEFFKENKSEVDAVIQRVFEQVNGTAQEEEDEEVAPVEEGSRKKRSEADETDDAGSDDSRPPPPAKKAKKLGNNTSTDAELARKLSSEINGRTSRRTTNAGGSTRKRKPNGLKKTKSSAEVNSEDDSAAEDDGKLGPKRKSGGRARGGFAKEYDLSAPLAAVLQVDKLSRPQVVKRLWDYIKGNELQNPANKREILCDTGLRAVFNTDKIDMFKMNKVLGEHLHLSGE